MGLGDERADGGTRPVKQSPEAAELGELMTYYSEALDEIYRLRQALAYEALVVGVHGEYKSFPKSRRQVLEAQVDRMQKAARGLSGHAYGAVSHMSLRHALCDAGAPETLTRWEFEQAIPRRRAS